MKFKKGDIIKDRRNNVKFKIKDLNDSNDIYLTFCNRRYYASYIDAFFEKDYSMYNNNKLFNELNNEI